MFQFTTTQIVNSANQLIVDDKHVGFKFGPTFKVTDTNRKICIYKADFEPEVADKATIDLSAWQDDLADDLYRMCIYVKSEGDQNPFYANAYGFKGKPFYIEFTSKSDAKTIKDVADKFQLAVYDTKQLVFSGDGSSLNVECVNGYLRIVKIEVEIWEEDDYKLVESCKILVNDYADNVISSDHISITIGNPGKGTYEQLLNDIILPTTENLSLNGVNASQLPMIGGQYTQYTVQLRKELEGYPGGIGINNPVESITNHVFFVESAVVNDFEEAFSTLATIETVPED